MLQLWAVFSCVAFIFVEGAIAGAGIAYYFVVCNPEKD